MPTIVIDLSPEMYRRLQEEARHVGKAPEAFTRELLETPLHAQEEPRSRTAWEVLQAAGRVHPLSEALRRQIIPGVSLDELRRVLTEAAGPTLSAIILEQRGPKP
jgi:predicted transcriptional regulator